MPPKVDPTQVVEITLRVTGGEAPPSAVLAPRTGPLGLPAKKVSDDIIKATQSWKGLNVTVKLICQNRQATIEVIPTASSYVVKALKEPLRDRKKEKNIKHNGNIPLKEIIEIAREFRPRSMAITLAGTVKEILGTCLSVGCTVDGKNPKDVQAEITDGTIEIPEN